MDDRDINPRMHNKMLKRKKKKKKEFNTMEMYYFVIRKQLYYVLLKFRAMKLLIYLLVASVVHVWMLRYKNEEL